MTANRGTQAQWEYHRLVLDGPASADDGEVEGAITQANMAEINGMGHDGWELISVMPGQQRIAGAPGERKPVTVLLFKRLRERDSGSRHLRSHSGL